jgi:hypothetical protein
LTVSAGGAAAREACRTIASKKISVTAHVAVFNPLSRPFVPPPLS